MLVYDKPSARTAAATPSYSGAALTTSLPSHLRLRLLFY